MRGVFWGVGEGAWKWKVLPTILEMEALGKKTIDQASDSLLPIVADNPHFISENICQLAS